MPNNNPKTVERREFLKQAAVGAGAVAVGMVALGCGSSNGTAPTSQLGTAAQVPTSAAWQFAIMADTQWLSADKDELNPNTCAVGLINQLNAEFIAQDVKFVVQVGDLADQASGASSESYYYSTTASQCEDTRALFAQALYNNGIGFFPCRGNHDDGSAQEFINIFPQTQNGEMNASPASVFTVIPAVDATAQPAPTKTGAAFTQGTNFTSIGSPVNYTGLSYGFDYNNARFILIDQFTPNNTLATGGAAAGVDGNTYSIETTAALQQPWVIGALGGKPTGGHALIFTHKGIILQQHVDVLFGDAPIDTTTPITTASPAETVTYTVAAGAANAFIRTMNTYGARMLFCGHDHNYNRCLVNTTDSGTAASITQILCQSVSSKFYTPNEDDASGNGQVPPCTSNDAFFCNGQRQTQLSRELYTVGYYIVTVDGANLNVDYYSAPAYPTYNTNVQNQITLTPTLTFSKRESFGYSLNGQQFLVATGAAFTTVKDTGPSGTVAQILAGTNSNANTDTSGRKFSNAVDTGWVKEKANTASDILILWGMGHTLGTVQTDVYALAMTYDSTKGTAFILATPDANGNWTNAVDQNLGGATTAVSGPWKASYGLGTYGMDPSSGTVWAVLNYNGYFAAVATVTL